MDIGSFMVVTYTNQKVKSCMQRVWKQPKLLRITEKTIMDNVLSDGYVESDLLAKKHQLDPACTCTVYYIIIIIIVIVIW